MKKLGEAELEIMKVLWKQERQMTSNEISDELAGIKDWKLSSLMTALSRLAQKEYVFCDRSTRTNYYTALISEQEYLKNENQTFLEKLYDNSVQKFIAGLYHSQQMSKKDIQELREYLDDLEKNSSV